MTAIATHDCFLTRIARASRAVDQGEWASGHALLTGLRQCGSHRGCPDGETCAAAAESLMGDLRGRVRDHNVA